MNLTGIHINWTAPYFARGKSGYGVEDYELLTTVLSALEWKRKYGKILLYTDEAGEAYYRSIGLLPLWDEVRRLNVPEGVSPISYWAAGKLYALGDVKGDVCMIDTDFILWEALPFDAPVTVAHFEPVGTEIYPGDLRYYDVDFEEFYGMDAAAPACNTALCCFRDEELKRVYLAAAYRFMERSKPGTNTLQYMVCAEQRLLGMIARERGIVPAVLLDERTVHSQRICSHTWGFKNTMRIDPGKRREFCIRLAKRIGRDHPEWREILMGIEGLHPYFFALSGALL